MRVSFIRTGERRYRVEVERDDGSVMHMPRGPGFDPWLPHDLVHLVVERHFGITHGVFGQLAGGGDAGTFFTIPHRRRDRVRRPGTRPAARGRADMARSELLTAASMHAWRERRGFADPVTIRPPEISGSLIAELDAVARRWHRLQIGRALTLEWPPQLTSRAHAAERERTPERRRARPPQPRRIV